MAAARGFEGEPIRGQKGLKGKLEGEGLPPRALVKPLAWLESSKNIASKSIAVVKNKTVNNNIVVTAQMLPRTLRFTHNILIG